MTVTMVLPTYNRLPALQDTLPFLLAVRGVDDIVIVDDASTDGSQAWLATLEDPRVRVVRQPRNRGPHAARNRGLEEARGEWVLFGEDDCRFPPDYLEVLLEEAAAHRADLVGAPWIQTDGVPLEQALARQPPPSAAPRTLDDVMTFPAAPVETPFLPALVLVHRRVFERLRYDEAYGGNAFREESDFFVRVARAGFRCLLTPRTCAWQMHRWDGGVHTARWRYELSSVRNTGLFLRRHGRWLHEQGLAPRPAVVWLRFAAWRAWSLFNHYSRPPAGRALRRLGLKR